MIVAWSCCACPLEYHASYIKYSIWDGTVFVAIDVRSIKKAIVSTIEFCRIKMIAPWEMISLGRALLFPVRLR